MAKRKNRTLPAPQVTHSPGLRVLELTASATATQNRDQAVASLKPTAWAGWTAAKARSTASRPRINPIVTSHVVDAWSRYAPGVRSRPAA